MFAEDVHEVRYRGLRILGVILEQGSHLPKVCFVSASLSQCYYVKKRTMEHWLEHRGLVTRSVAGLTTL